MSNLEGEVPELDIKLKSKKKKKKKTKKVTKEEKPTNTESKEEIKVYEDLPDFVLPDKKKKKPKNEIKETWLDSERDYDYFELLNRIQGMLQESGSSSNQSAKMKLPPPLLAKDGTTKTVWINFPIICEKMERTVEHVQTYALTELNTTGSLDGNQGLSLKGRFQSKQIENVIKHYISEFVKCNTCGSISNELKKENRLQFLHCKLVYLEEQYKVLNKVMFIQ